MWVAMRGSMHDPVGTRVGRRGRQPGVGGVETEDLAWRKWEFVEITSIIYEE